MKSNQKVTAMRIFLIGNNPIELGDISDKIKQITSESILVDYGFDVSAALKSIRKIAPACILVDDNIGRKALKKLTELIRKGGKTAEIPIAVLKNSNYSESGLLIAREFIMKEGLTPHGLQRSIQNVITRTSAVS